MELSGILKTSRSRWIGVISLLAVAAALVLLFARPDRKQPNVIVILVDTLRADHLSFNGYERTTSPHLDRFANESLNFTRAVSASSWTPPSVASLFTGFYPSVHEFMPVPWEGTRSKWTSRIDDKFKVLAESFKEGGFKTAAYIANPVVSEKLGFSQGFDIFESNGVTTAGKINAKAYEYIDSVRNSENPFFLYLHYMDPHSPYEPPLKFQKFNGALQSKDYPEKMTRFMRRYDGEISFTDYRLGQLFNWLKGRDLYDSTVILLVADHGEQFRERGFHGHASHLHQEEVHVPFILKPQADRDAKGVNTTVVSLIDAYPTLLDLAGLNTEIPLQGYSLTSNLSTRKNTGVMAEVLRHKNFKIYVRPDGKKLIAQFEKPRGFVLEDVQNMLSTSVYDTVSDFFETTPLEDAKLDHELRLEFVEAYRKSFALNEAFGAEEVPLDEESYQKLKSLGYF